MLKPTRQLNQMEDESENIYLTSLIDRYAARPDSLDNLCLAEFAANYSYTASGGGDEDVETYDVLPSPEEVEGARKHNSYQAEEWTRYHVQAHQASHHSLSQVQHRERS